MPEVCRTASCTPTSIFKASDSPTKTLITSKAAVRIPRPTLLGRELAIIPQREFP